MGFQEDVEPGSVEFVFVNIFGHLHVFKTDCTESVAFPIWIKK